MLRQQPLEPAQTAGRGVAAHAGVEHPHRMSLGDESLGDQRRVRLVLVHSEPGGQAVAEEDDQGVGGRWLGSRSAEEAASAV